MASMTPSLRWLLALSSFFPIVLGAQDASGVAVTGAVLDPQQAGAFGAKITLRRADGGEVGSTAADSRGAFRFEGVPPGSYDVQIQQPGFKPSVSRIRIGNQPPRPFHVVLTLAEVLQEVTVGSDV